MNKFIALLLIVLLWSCSKPEVTAPTPIEPLPSESQLRWHDMEMNAFIHFSINTFTDMEWGMGDEKPSKFNPTALDVNQWVSVLKEAGFKGIILTAKHHDGFCLWPSSYTEHSIKNSPVKNVNLVKALADACASNDMKFGIYLSPWDRNHADYGTPAYVDYYRNQLKELFTSEYGSKFEMWFDGANGGTGYYGGKNEKRTIDGSKYYDWPGTLQLVRNMEPGIIFFSDAGPGVRWVGNEKGVAGETNWNMISTDTLFAGKAGIEKLLNTGSENGAQWVPAETDVSIRPGWFYHAKEDSMVKSPERLFDIYLTSVGRGSVLLLNVPPDRRGLIHENDIASLKGFRSLLDREFAHDFASESEATSNDFRGEDARYSAAMTTDNNPETYWAVDDGKTSGSIELTWKEDVAIKYVVLSEPLKMGQRIKSFKVETEQEGKWVEIASGTTVGHKRILKVEPVSVKKLRVTVTDSRACPLISRIAVY